MKTNPLGSMPHDASTSQQWIAWHQALKKRYGKKTANELFLMAWGKRRNYSADTVQLHKYMSSQGVDMDTGIMDMFDSVADKLGDTLGFVGNTLKIIVIILVLGIALLTYNIAKNPEIIGKILIPGK